MAIHLDFDSASQICGRTKQVMVYGFQHCRYTQVSTALKSDASPFSKVFDCSIGGPFAHPNVLTTLEGSVIERIKIPLLEQDDAVRELKQYCKAGLTNIIMENIKRSKAKLPLIPVLFVVDIDNNKHTLHPETISSKTHTFVTLGELRRAYKLCNDPGLLPEVKEIANKTFKFVKTKERKPEEVKGVGSAKSSFSLQQIKPFWAHAEWNKHWDKRVESSSKKPISSAEKEKRMFWRKQLNAHF